MLILLDSFWLKNKYEGHALSLCILLKFLKSA